MSTLENIPGIGPALRRGLDTLGIADAAALAKADVATITQVRGISAARAETFIAAAKRLAAAADPEQGARETETATPRSPDKKSKAADKSKGAKKEAAKPKTKEKKSGKDKSGKSGKARKAKPSKKKGKTKKG
jgi:Holliday junction resolvasome RuvABC DNA-binding subunit